MTTATQAEFARAHGVSRAAITQWKVRGYVTMDGDRVAVEASDKVLEEFGKGRFDRDRKAGAGGVKLLTPGANLTPVSALAPPLNDAQRPDAMMRRHANAFPGVLTLATSVGCPSNLVLALLDHVPMATVRPLVEGVVAKERAAAVELADENGPPPGYATWADHPWFTEPPLTEGEWAELETEHRDTAA